VLIAGSRAMAAALIIVFREVLEAGLIIGCGLGRVARRGAADPGGFGWDRGGALGSAFWSRASRHKISSAFDGRGQELLSAAVLGWRWTMLAWTWCGWPSMP